MLKNLSTLPSNQIFGDFWHIIETEKEEEDCLHSSEKKTIGCLNIVLDVIFLLVTYFNIKVKL